MKMNDLATAPGLSAGLDAAAFARAFPFHLRVDQGMRIQALGSSLVDALHDIALSDPLDRHFEVRRPLGAVSVEAFRRHGARLVNLRARQQPLLQLRGSAEMLDDGGLLLVVSPVLQSLEAMQALGLRFDHFARHDGVADMLLMARTTQSSLADAQRMAQCLQGRTSQLDTILELGQNGVAAFDAAGVLAHTNQALRSMLQLSATETIGLSLSDMELRLQRLRDPAAAGSPIFVASAGDEDPPRELVLAVPRPATLRVTSRRAQDGGLVFYLRDVTAETEIDRMKSEFLSTAAHELRTPMVSVFGFTELLLNRPVGEERRREMLQTIHRQSGLLITMVNELLDLARIEARQGKDLHRETQPMGPLLRLAVDGMAGRSDGLRIVCRSSHDEASVCVDSEKFHRVITNVLSNAVKYSPAGGDVVVDTLSGSHEGQPAVGVRVTDLGIGMTAAQTARIFDRFYRADPSGHIPGTGLGMSLVREIVTLHGGTVEVVSQPGQGTAVTLWWPLAESSQPA
jgi:signal transduction histidine kinase